MIRRVARQRRPLCMEAARRVRIERPDALQEDRLHTIIPGMVIANGNR